MVCYPCNRDLLSRLRSSRRTALSLKSSLQAQESWVALSLKPTNKPRHHRSILGQQVPTLVLLVLPTFPPLPASPSMKHARSSTSSHLKAAKQI